MFPNTEVMLVTNRLIDKCRYTCKCIHQSDSNFWHVPVCILRKHETIYLESKGIRHTRIFKKARVRKVHHDKYIDGVLHYIVVNIFSLCCTFKYNQNILPGIGFETKQKR